MKTDPIPSDADERIVRTTMDGEASVLLWWTKTPTLPGDRVGVVGGFQATSASATVAVLEQAAERLAMEGCTRAIGPMDGNTWRNYRFVTGGGTALPFLFEPVHPPEWPGWWKAAGFAPLAEYYSTATNDLAAHDPRVGRVAERLKADGVVIRSIDLEDFERELIRIHDVSVISFRDNFLYTPVEQAEFVAQYRSLQARVRPELVLLAEHHGRPVGYVFVTPDFAQLQRGEPLTTAIVKTLAVVPGRKYAGLGAVLLDAVHGAARCLGFARAIHALMHERNQSRNLSAHYGETIRRYTLFSRQLIPR